MRKSNFQKGIFMILGCAILMTVSCDILPEEVIRDSDLVGIWNFDDVSAEIYVGKVNITRVLVVSHGYTQEEAEFLLDSLVSDYLEEEMGTTLILNDNHTYLIDNEREDESGTWEFDEQKDALRLTKTGEKVPEKFTIEHLTQTTMILHMPNRFKVIDLNEDGKKEMNCTIVAEIQMVKEKPVN